MSHRPNDVLVSIDYEYGTAAVGWDDREGLLWLTSDADRGPGTGLRAYDAAIECISDEHTIQGGRLPPAAVGAEVVDDAGKRIRAAADNGAWVVVVDYEADEPLPVRFFDEAGRTVARPWPEEWPRDSVRDADDPCPACGGTSWSVVTRPANWQGFPEEIAGDLEPSRVVICDECGNGIAMGVFISAPSEDEPDASEEAELQLSEVLEARDRATKEAIGQAAFEIYRVKGFASHLLSWSSRDAISEVTLGDAHWEGQTWRPSQIEVTTSLRDFDRPERKEESAAREALQPMAGGASGDWPNRSEAGLSIWLDRDEREHRRRAAEADVRRLTLPIDGAPHEWTVASSGESWAAVHRNESVTLTVRATGVPVTDVEVERVSDRGSISAPKFPE